MVSRIRDAEAKYHRPKQSVALLAVSKAQRRREIEYAIDAGQRHFGENYLQEALEKINVLQKHEVIWHFIGSIQSNKTRLIAENFSWIHGISRIEIAEQLNKYRPVNLPLLNVCVQVNISKENTKNGVSLRELSSLVMAIDALERLQLRGLMAMPAPIQNFLEQRSIYQSVARAQCKLIEKGFTLDTLSMGMSDDFEAAIAAGSNMVRIGKAIFGI